MGPIPKYTLFYETDHGREIFVGQYPSRAGARFAARHRTVGLWVVRDACSWQTVERFEVVNRWELILIFPVPAPLAALWYRLAG